MQRLERTYKRERGRLLAFIRSRVSAREDAEDILQDVFTQAVKSLSVTEPIDNLIGWLYTVARNRIVDLYRRRSGRSFSSRRWRAGPFASWPKRAGPRSTP